VSVASGLSDKQVNFMSGAFISGSHAATFDYTQGSLSASIVSGTFYGDGSNLTGISGGSGSPGGLNTQVQFNNAGAFAGDADFTFNSTTNTLSASVVSGTIYGAVYPSGTYDMDIMFNGGGKLSGSANLTYDYASSTLTIAGPVSVNANTGDVLLIAVTGAAELSGHTGITMTAAEGDALLSSSGTFSITSDSNNVDIAANGAGATINLNNNVNAAANITSSGDHVSASLVYVSRLSASLLFGDGGGITGITAAPAGSTTQLQFNNAGTTGASADLTFDDSTNKLVLTGTLVATSSGGYEFSLSGSTLVSTFGSFIKGDYALIGDGPNGVLIDAGITSGADVAIVAANGNALMTAGGYGGMPKDVIGASLTVGGGIAGSVNTIGTYNNAGIDVHSVNTLSLSGSTVDITGSTIHLTSSGGQTTAIVHGNLSASVNISASAFYGDGSNLSGVSATPGGSDTYIQFNDGGSSFGGEANFTFNKTTDLFKISGSTTITGGLDQGHNSPSNYFKLSTAYGSALTTTSGEFFHFPNQQTIVAGQVYYLSGTSNPIAKMTASAVGGGAASLVGLSVGTALETDGLLLRGFYNYSGAATASISGAVTAGAFEEGKQIYASEVTPGHLTTVQPATAGNVVRVMGHAVTTTLMYFNPSPDFVTV
jgi:hypothetical protein